MLVGCDPALLEPPLNVLRLTLHPGGLAPRIRNLHQWAAHLHQQATHRAEHTHDRRHLELVAEVESYLDRPPGPDDHRTGAHPRARDRGRHAPVLQHLGAARHRDRRHARRACTSRRSCPPTSRPGRRSVAERSVDHRVQLDLDLPARVEQPLDHDHRAGRPDRAEDLAVDCADGSPSAASTTYCRVRITSSTVPPSSSSAVRAISQQRLA